MFSVDDFNIQPSLGLIEKDRETVNGRVGFSESRGLFGAMSNI